MGASGLPRLTRREVVLRAGLLSATMLPWPALAQKSPREGLNFIAYRNGDQLGFHRIDFSEVDSRTVVEIEIAFDVSFAFIPLYRYRHKNREIWENDRLYAMSTETDDNGTAYKVEARRDGNRLLVDGANGRLDLPGDTLTTSYWNEAAMASGAWLDTQSGMLARSEVTKRATEPVQVDGKTLEATPYDLVGDITCSLWYRDGHWVKLLFAGEDGSLIEYALQPGTQSG